MRSHPRAFNRSKDTIVYTLKVQLAQLDTTFYNRSTFAACMLMRD
jgi:hypothetical protein